MLAHTIRSLAMIATLFISAAASAQQVEVFNVVGSNPGSSSQDYSGQVGVVKSGDTWQIEWRVGGSMVRGTGLIMDGNYLAAAGLLEGAPFVFIMRKDGNRYVGQWTVQGQTKVGKEIWTPK